MVDVHQYASSLHAGFGLKPQAAPDTFEPGAYPQQRCKAPQPSANTNITQDSDVALAGEPISAETESRNHTLSTTYDLCYNDCRMALAAALREDPPASEVFVQGTSDIEVLTNGNRQDGTQGPQFRAPTGAFDVFRTYNGAAENGIEALMLEVSGASAGDNNFPRGVDAVWDDGTFAYLDIHRGFVGGSAGRFGAPMTATGAGESILLRAGSGIRNRLIAPHHYYSGLIHHSDIGMWQAMVGLTANGFTMSWSGKGTVGLEVPWEGVHLPSLQSVDPTAGAGLDPSALAFSPMVKAGKHLVYLVIVTATESILLGGLNVTSFNYQVAGGVSGVDDVAGTDERTGTVLGAHVPTGSIGVHLVEDPRAIKLAQLGAKGTDQKARIVFAFRDSLGNMLYEQALWNNFGQLVYTPTTGGGTVSGTLTFSGQRHSPTSRSFIHQEFAAAA